MRAPSVTIHERLPGARVIVTGGARGIGGEIASRFASEGARVGILDRLVAEGSAHAASIGGRFHEVDLADPDSTAAAMAAAIEALDGLDILVNSAGIFRLTPLLDITVPEWVQMFAVNTRAMLTTMQHAARTMLGAEHGGRIINLASLAAKKGGANEAH